MVCSIGSPYSTLTDYAEETFTTRNQTIINSRWFGRAATTLGLSNQVLSNDYLNAYQGLDRSGNHLRRQLLNRNSTPGRDLTFSAPKSVSLLALIVGKEQITKAHSKAVNRALEYIEQNCIFTRTGAGGRISQQTKNMMVAIFQHHHSRNLDPNLHSHCVIFNQTQGKDGKWRSMNNRELYQQKMTLGAVYHHELGRELQQLGYSLEWNQNGTFEIAGFETSQLKQFSSRRAEIINLAGENSSSKSKALACISTRNTKKYVNQSERVALKASWQEKFNSLNIVTLQHSPQKPLVNNEQLFSRRDLIDQSIQTLSEREGKTQFFEHQLLKEVLVQAQGKHQLDKLQHDIKQHPSLIPIENQKLTTIDLYRIERTRQTEENRRVSSQRVEPNILQLATSAQFDQSLSGEIFSFVSIVDDRERKLQTSLDYLKFEDAKPFQTVILTDTKIDELKLTSQIRQELTLQNKLGANTINTVILESKNSTKPEIALLQNYQVGDAIKFNRSSVKFSNQRFYKVLAVDEQNQVLKLGDRLGNRIDLPITRYQNREVFKVVRRELRIGEKMRFNRGQYINGKQVSAGQSFIITNIKDKQRITIKTQGQQSIVKADNLFLSEYNYVDTLDKYQGKTINNCIYHPSTNKSKQLFQQDIYTVAMKTKEKLTVYTSDNKWQQTTTIEAQQLQPNMELFEQSSAQSIDDTLFELASSAKYVVLNRDLNVSNSGDCQVYHSRDGVMIEKDLHNLSIYYDGKSIQFDQDFNVVKNDFIEQEIYQLNQTQHHELMLVFKLFNSIYLSGRSPTLKRSLIEI
jgi:conjugative relaxase-like TrwC/TraI family protein